ncbi:hypothetical protein HYC85_031304 [Camellia sinensis]|uniref:PPM-type phosphatase domain-containing protein n=1 Tax=Camellia sinensis TaxID=4442 RepID=A0A7J7FR67_CAMSI|nr:hypothetical protein HYC85_031304 [Camellia sinensis]
MTTGTLKAHLASKELTRDHNLHTKDVRARIEAAGGDITEWDPPLINGHFPMTPAIGDVPLKMYLVVASDGIFQSLEPKDVCDLLQDAHFQGNKKSKQKSSCLLLSSLADCIVHNAFEKGSTDNLFAVVVPLMSVGFNTRTLVDIDSIRDKSCSQYELAVSDGGEAAKREREDEGVREVKLRNLKT